MDRVRLEQRHALPVHVADELGQPAARKPPVRQRGIELDVEATVESSRFPQDVPELVAAADGGALVPEARYNRALCLVRLGRVQEAKLALTPFAHGDYAGYRRAEARALLNALSTQ